MKRLSIAAFVTASVLALGSPALAQCNGCGGCGTKAATAAAPCHSATGSVGDVRAVKLASLTGDTVALGEHIGKMPVVLVAAGTDSASRSALALAQQLVSADTAMKAHTIAVVAGSRKAVAAISKSLKLGYTVLPDPGKMFAAAIGTKKLPLVAFYDASGMMTQAERQITKETMMAGMKAALGAQQATDPVCGMKVTPDSAAAKYEYKGQTYYFCSAACRDNFTKNPDKYLAQ